MDATLPDIGKISSFWNEPLSQALNETLTGRFVWNFLPGIHEEAWTNAVTYDAMVKVVFMRRPKRGEDYQAVTHGVKSLRGKLVNYIVKETIEDFELLLEWRHPDGYVLDESLSSYDEDSRTHELVMIKRG